MTPPQLCVIICLTVFGLAQCNTYTTHKWDSRAFADEALEFLKIENELLRQRTYALNLVEFNYITNLTEYNSQLEINLTKEFAAAKKDLAKRIRHAGYNEINDEFIKRQVKPMSDFGSSILSDSDFEKLTESTQNMISNYATSTVCDYKNASICGLTLSDIDKRKKNSEDIAELAYYSTQWYDVVGTPMRDNFKTYVDLSNKAAYLNNYTSHADYWIQEYEDTDFEANIHSAYKAILPLYKELHGYLRHRMQEQYGNDVLSTSGNIPIHLSQSIQSHIDFYLPFRDVPPVNITTELQRLDFNVTRMIQFADEFFKSMDMRPLPESFWKLSVVERRPNVSMVCHPTAWDMAAYNDTDVRIIMCAEVNEYFWRAIHHELGHSQYQMQFEKQPFIFRNAPNPGFHEAIGDLIALSVGTQRHLKQIGFVTDGELDEKSRINKLFEIAVTKIIYQPFSYSVDKWRFKVFRNEIDESIWNCAFWKIYSEYAGIEPPTQRTEKNFDPPYVYHINIDMDVLRYFMANIFQFQFHKALCLKAGLYKPNNTEYTLDNCDIYKSKEAGKALGNFLALGRSIHWKEALKEFTGETSLDPTALLEYFKPLYEWLQQENERLNVTIGWKITDKVTCNSAGLFDESEEGF